MGQARNRGTVEERKTKALLEGRVKRTKIYWDDGMQFMTALVNFLFYKKK